MTTELKTREDRLRRIARGRGWMLKKERGQVFANDGKPVFWLADPVNDDWHDVTLDEAEKLLAAVKPGDSLRDALSATQSGPSG